MARGSITKRGDAWRIAIELPPDPETGKRRQRFETFVGLKRDADKRLTELLAVADQHKLGVTSTTTVTEYLDRWLADYAVTLAPKTRASYAHVTRLYVVPMLGGVRLDRLTPSHIVGVLAKLRDAPRSDGRDGHLGPSTIRAVYRLLHTALATAVKWRILTANPADGVDAPRVPRRDMQSFAVEQAQQCLAATTEEGTK